MKKWWTLQNDLPMLEEGDKRRIEYITGGIPLLLRPLIGLGPDKFNESTFLNFLELQAVTENVATFMEFRHTKEWER